LAQSVPFNGDDVNTEIFFRLKLTRVQVTKRKYFMKMPTVSDGVTAERGASPVASWACSRKDR